MGMGMGVKGEDKGMGVGVVLILELGASLGIGTLSCLGTGLTRIGAGVMLAKGWAGVVCSVGAGGTLGRAVVCGILGLGNGVKEPVGGREGIAGEERGGVGTPSVGIGELCAVGSWLSLLDSGVAFLLAVCCRESERLNVKTAVVKPTASRSKAAMLAQADGPEIAPERLKFGTTLSAAYSSRAVARSNSCNRLS